MRPEIDVPSLVSGEPTGVGERLANVQLRSSRCAYYAAGSDGRRAATRSHAAVQATAGDGGQNVCTKLGADRTS